MKSMYRTILFLSLSMMSVKYCCAQVSISSPASAPDASAMLDVKSTTKGILVPRMSSTQRGLITNAVKGLMVFDIDTSSFWFYNGSAWVEMAGGSGTNYWSTNGLDIYNNNTGKVWVGTSNATGYLTVKAPFNVAPWFFMSETGTGSTDFMSASIFPGGGTTLSRTGTLDGSFGGSTGFTISNTKNAPILFSTNLTEKMRILASGNIGIGTSTPAAKLEILTADAQWGTVHNNGTVSMGTYIGGGGGWLATKSSSPLYFATGYNGGSTPQMTLISNGNFGIGISNPSARLEVLSNDASYGLLQTSGAVSVGTYIGSAGGWFGTKSNHPLYFFTNNGNAQMTLLTNGNVGIGTITPAYKLSVNGSIQSKEVRVETGWADFVFDTGYTLKPLAEVEQYIHKNKHLPEIPAAADIQKNGLALGETQTKMMQKIEELTLYVIDLQKQINELKAKNDENK